MCLKRYFIGIVILLAYLLNSGYAQNDAQIGHSTLWPNLSNPGALENYKAPLAGADFRVQWLGIEGQPFTQTVFAQMPFPNSPVIAGMVLSNELAGAHQVFHADFQMAYPVKIKKQVYQFGASLGFIQYAFLESRLRAAEGIYTDNTLLHNDPTLGNSNVAKVVPNFNVGFKTKWKAIGLNIGIEHLFASKIKLTVPTGTAITQYMPLLHAGLSYNWPLQVNNWQFKSAAYFKSNFSKSMIDWQSFATYNDKWRVGLLIRGFAPRNFDAAGALFAYVLNEQMQFNYSFEWPINKLSQVTYGTQELSLVYKLQEPPPPSRGKIIFSPRFL